MILSNRSSFKKIKHISLIFAATCLTSHAEENKPSDYVYFEDFSKTSLENWNIKDKTQWIVNKEGHLQSVNNTTKVGVGCSSPKFNHKDIHIEFDFNLLDGKEIEFKINLDRGGHICRFVVNQEGFYMRVNRNKNIPIEEAFNMEKYAVMIEPNQWHKMEIKIDGDKITGTIPGKGGKTYQYEHFNNGIGNFGLAAKGKSILFDNFKIKPLLATKE